MTGRTVEEAVEAALEQLGVAETDAEIVIVEEPKSAMFGLRRSGARIRARVRPIQLRAKRPSRRPRVPSSSGDRGHRRQASRSETPSSQNKKTEDDEGRAKGAPGSGSGSTRAQSRQDQAPGQNGSLKSRQRAGKKASEASNVSVGNDGSPAEGGRQRSRLARARWPRTTVERTRRSGRRIVERSRARHWIT